MPLFIAFLISAGVALASTATLLPAALFLVTKPLTQILVIAHALRRGAPAAGGRNALLVGLVLSLVGDIALMWPQGFLAGLVAFLCAHLAYLVAFTRAQRFAARWQPFVAYGLVTAVVLSLLWPGVPGPLRVPVVAYVVCLSAMAAQAATVWLGLRGQPGAALARYAAIGGALFVLSDALLATNKFMGPLPYPSLWTLPAYWAAQWLIASSLPPKR